jgi:uncharacterized protein YecT (DUF1311 family)
MMAASSYRDAKCAFLNEPNEPSAWGIMRAADCRSDETGRREIELLDIAAP